MDILETRVQQALKLILEADELTRQGTAQAWEVARLYQQAAKLLQVSHAACLERARGKWIWTLERNEEGQEGQVVQVWIGARGEIW